MFIRYEYFLFHKLKFRKFHKFMAFQSWTLNDQREWTKLVGVSVSQLSRSAVSDSATPWIAAQRITGLPVHHQLPEFAQTHARRVGDAIQPSHPLSSPSPPAPNPSQHQGLFQQVNSSHEVAEVLEFQLQHQSFQWTPRTDLL